MSERRMKDALLERYLASDLDEATHAEIAKALESSETDRKRLEELRADSAAFLISHPPHQVLSKLPINSAPRKRLGLVQLLGVAFACAAALVLVVARWPWPSDEGPEFAVKGGLTWSVYAKQGEKTVLLAPDSTVAPNTAIRFEVKAPTQGFLAIMGRDSGGVVTTYYPYNGNQAAPYSPSERLLPTAIALDDTPGSETFYALFSEQPFEIAPLAKQLQTEQMLQNLPKSLTGSTFTVKKRVPDKSP